MTSRMPFGCGCPGANMFGRHLPGCVHNVPLPVPPGFDEQAVLIEASLAQYDTDLEKVTAERDAMRAVVSTARIAAQIYRGQHQVFDNLAAALAALDEKTKRSA